MHFTSPFTTLFAFFPDSQKYHANFVIPILHCPFLFSVPNRQSYFPFRSPLPILRFRSPFSFLVTSIPSHSHSPVLFRFLFTFPVPVPISHPNSHSYFHFHFHSHFLFTISIPHSQSLFPITNSYFTFLFMFLIYGGRELP